MVFSLRNLLLATLACLSGLLFFQSWNTINQVAAINRNVTNIGDNWLPSVARSSDMNTNTSDMRVAEGAHIMSTVPADMDKAEADFQASLDALKKNEAAYAPLISSPEERALYDRYKSGLNRYLELHNQLFSLSRQNRNQEAADLFRGPLRAAFDDYSDALGKIVELNTAGAEQDKARAAGQYNEARTLAFILAGIAVALSGAAVWLVLSQVIRPINRVTGAMKSVSEGRLETDIPYAQAQTEVGILARTLVVFRDGLKEAERLREAAGRQKEIAEQERKAQMIALANAFESSVGTIVEHVSAAATEMQAAAAQLTATAQETSAQSMAVSSAAEEAGANVTSVAASAEELGASVEEIGRQVQTSAAISENAVKESHVAAGIVAELNDITLSIGSVVDLIAGLAGQTNLLALNATIESARAGEAGKGFAVVASEVKALAAQTQRATTEISDKIGHIQSATGRAVTAIQSISGTIRTISDTSTAIAGAVEQQSAATREIVEAVAQASTGTQEVTNNITGVAQAAEQTGEAASQVLASSSELSTQAERLHMEMDRFLETVRAA